MTSVSRAITAAIEQLELEARTAETNAGELQDKARTCRDLVTRLRQMFDVSPMQPPSPRTVPSARKERPAPTPAPVPSDDPFDAGGLKVAAARPVLEDPPVKTAPIVRTTSEAPAKPSPPPAAAAPPLVPVETPRDPGLTPASWRSKVAFWLIKSIFTTDELQHVGDIVIAIHDQFGSAPYDQVELTLQELAEEGAIRRGPEPGLCYVAVPVGSAKPQKSSEHLTATKDQLHQLNRVLSTGASYQTRELLRNMANNGQPITELLLQSVLDQMVTERQIEKIPTPQGSRYRKRVGWKERAS